MFIIFLCWLFVPHLTLLGKVLFLDKVQPVRLLLGLGLLSFIQLVLVIRRLAAEPHKLWPRRLVIPYTLAVLAVELLLAFYAKDRSPGFIGLHAAIALSVPVPIIIYTVLRKQYVVAAAVLALFSVASAGMVNPFYRGTAMLTTSSLSESIKSLSKEDHGRWATDAGYLENFPLLNGAPSLTGVYTYPQLALWKTADNGSVSDIYNRYAHVNAVFDRNLDVQTPSQLLLIAPDHFDVVMEPCGTFTKQEHISFILTDAPITDQCLSPLKTITYPEHTFYIYKTIP